MLTTEAAIVEINEMKNPAGAGAGMDDMDYLQNARRRGNAPSGFWQRKRSTLVRL
jgi:hypothetical protein